LVLHFDEVVGDSIAFSLRRFNGRTLAMVKYDKLRVSAKLRLNTI
jgi:hypothetical protein